MTPRMRTLPQAIAEIKASDPDTPLTLSTLRLLVNRGEIPVTDIRNRRLVNMNALYEYLENGVFLPTEARCADIPISGTVNGNIRRIAE